MNIFNGVLQESLFSLGFNGVDSDVWFCVTKQTVLMIFVCVLVTGQDECQFERKAPLQIIVTL